MIYLNNASTTFPKPQEVLEAVNNSITMPPFNYGRTNISRGIKNIIQDTRETVNSFFNLNDKYCTIFTSGSTFSLNLALKGLNLKNRHVIITATEHNSVIRPLNKLEKTNNVRLTVAGCDEFGYVDPQNIAEEIKDDTALICINHCSNVTGTIQNIKQISEIAKSRNILLLVDGSQAAGNTEVNISELNVDIYCFTAHKSLYGLMGCGGLIFKKNLELSTLIEGGTGTFSSNPYQPEVLPSKFEAGTMNLPGIAALEAGMNWVKKTGIETIKNRKRDIILSIFNELKAIDRIKFFFNPELSSFSVLSFIVEGIETNEIGYILANSFDIQIRTGIHCAAFMNKFINIAESGTARISPSYFTTDNETEKLILALKKIINNL